MNGARDTGSSMKQSKKTPAFEEVTEIFTAPDKGSCGNKSSQFLVIMKKGRRAYFTHRPTDSKVLIGRSSGSNFKIDDPYFPRRAAELITDPLPLLRFAAKAGEKGLVLQIRTGEAVKFFGYRLYLLDRGDPIRNHPIGDLQRKHGLSRKTLLFLPAAAVILFGLIAIASPNKSSNQSLANSEVTVKLGSLFAKYSIDEIVLPKQRKVPEPAWRSTPKSRITHSQNRFPSSQGGTRPAKLPSVRRISFRSANSAIDLTTSLTRTLYTAEKRFQEGDLEGSSQLIKPFLPLLTARQKKQIIDRLDPYAEKIYRRAYILKPYDRQGSAKMMELLARSGLDLLPSVRKAIKQSKPEKK